jgi:acyl-CoA synthetase (AMP-forming)/AMP-acid ligase II
MTSRASRLNQALGILGVFATLRRAGLIAPMRPDRYLKMAAAMRREGMGMTVGFAGAAQRCPDRPGLVDELGTLTWRQLDERINALAAALQALPSGQPKVIGIMCRNHRGFVEAVVAANRIGSDVLLLNTSFAGPAMADVVNREGVDAVIYDEEFTATVDRALAHTPDAVRIVAWTDGQHRLTVEKLIADHAGRQPERTGGKGGIILLTSGTTGNPIEVEKTLAAHPEVAEAAVIGVDDEQYGQRLAAFVVLEPGGTATGDALKQHVRDNLANYKVPREIPVLDELPRGSTGKVLRADPQSRVNG